MICIAPLAPRIYEGGAPKGRGEEIAAKILPPARLTAIHPPRKRGGKMRASREQCFALQEYGLPRQCEHWLAMTAKV